MAASKSDTSDQFLDYLVYAPVGFALETIDNLPKYVQRGKSQITLGRFVARTAARKGSSTVESIAERLVNEASQVVVDLFNIDLTPDRKAAPLAEVTPIKPGADVDLPLAQYDSQAAAQIVKLLQQLTPDELAEIEAYEKRGRNRITIIRKIAQLRSAG